MTLFLKNSRKTIIMFHEENFLVIDNRNTWRNKLTEYFFWLKKLSFFKHFQTLSEKNWSFVEVFFSGVVITEFYVCVGFFWGKTSFFAIISFFVVFGHWAKKFRRFFWKIFDVVVKTIFYVSMGVFCAKWLFLNEKLFFIVCGSWASNFWRFVGNFRGVCSEDFSMGLS